ncbi:MAG: hypothetical protein WB392_09375 [Methanotrichaceae archaeon]
MPTMISKETTSLLFQYISALFINLSEKALDQDILIIGTGGDISIKLGSVAISAAGPVSWAYADST